MAAPTHSRVLLILFDGFNTLDMNGPYEVLRKSGMRTSVKIDVASETEMTNSVEGVHVKRDIPLNDKLIESLSTYDTLVVPGGPAGEGKPVDVQAAKIKSPFMRLIKAFAELPSTTEQYPRLLLSICTGALFLGTLGVFNGGRICTTHWGAYDNLANRNKISASSAGTKPGTVLQARFVDSGLNDKGIRVLSSGGISCGLDASLYVVKLRWGEAEAIDTASILDLAWRKTEGVVDYED